MGIWKMNKNTSPLAKYSDGVPLTANGDYLKTNYKDPKKRYELAERLVWAKLPDWKKEVVAKCKATGGADGPNGNDRIFTEYFHEIVQLAENDKTDFAGVEELRPAPEVTTPETSLT
jgi:hypothetical protein